MKLYGVPASRALRSIWAAEEVGVQYEHIPTHFLNDSKEAEYLAVNPNGRIPALVDGDLVLFESMAINLYLAKQYGGKLYPTEPADEARTIQWTIWGMTEVEPHLVVMVANKMMLPEDQRDPALVTAAEQSIERPLGVLDDHLSEREYLLGGDFTIADLNVAGALALSGFVGFDFSKFEQVSRWFARCSSRPSLAAAQAK